MSLSLKSHHNTTNSNLLIVTRENLLIWIFAIIYIFVSQDPNLGYQTELTVALSELIMQGFISNLSVFHLVVFALAFHVIIKYNHLFWGKRFGKERTIFFFTLVFVVFSMINPNNATNNPIFGMPLLSDPGLYVYVVFLYALFFIKNDDELWNLLYKITKAVLMIGAFRVCLLLTGWLLGYSFTFYSVNVTTMEEDTLIIGALFSVLFFVKYYHSRQKRYLIIWLLFFLLQVFSFRRSGMLLTLLVNSAFFLLVQSEYSKHKKYLTIMFTILVLFLLSINMHVLSDSAQLYLNRYFGQFVELPDSYQYEEVAKNLHIEQSTYAMLEHAINLPFWGFGYGESDTRVRVTFLGNTGIHNAYFKLWEEIGLFALIYYLIIIGFVIHQAWVTLMLRIKLAPWLLNLRIGVLAFLIFFFINAYVLMMVNLTGLKMRVMLVLCIVFLFRFCHNNQNVLLNSFSKK